MCYSIKHVELIRNKTPYPFLFCSFWNLSCAWRGAAVLPTSKKFPSEDIFIRPLALDVNGQNLKAQPSTLQTVVVIFFLLKIIVFGKNGKKGAQHSLISE